ncbi:MAG: 2Fe-2S iron-sulfur cluster-binding protein, partial [Clostridiales bacterium]
MNPLITFLPSKTEYQAQKGENLLDIAGKAHVMVEGNCGGAGSCGKCRVQIIEGVATAPTDAEKKLLSAKDLQEGYRLACHTEVIDDDLLVIVEQRHETILRKSNLRSLVGDFAIDSLIKKYYLQLAEPSMEDQLGDVERILAALPEDCTFNPLVLGELPNVLRDNGFKVTAVVKNKEVISVEAGDTSQRCYGIAFDIGTTTVVGMLLDLHDGKAVACSAATNPQNIFGSDVISRITYVITNPASRQLMKKRMRDCINNIISDFQDVCDVKNEEIYDATVVGNTTMSHLFLGLDPSALSRAPFIP